jgi:acyl-CoA thioester hydrolase
MVELKLRIDWAELDLFGHVNNVMFVKYAQAARLNYWEEVGIYQNFQKTKQGPMVASVQCDFKKPLFFPGHVTIQTEMVYIKTTSFSLKHDMYNDDGELVATATDVEVMFDFTENIKIPVPQWIRDRVAETDKLIS